VTNVLQDKRVLVTRAKGQNKKLSQQLAALGAQPVELPTIQIGFPDDLAPLDAALANLTSYDWLIFTSVNGVTHFWQRFLALQCERESLDQVRIAAIGPATADRLASLGLAAEHIPREHVAEALVESLPAITGERVLIPTADIARPTLPDGLQARGAIVNSVVAYQTQPAPTPADLAGRLAGLDILTFTSSSTVQNFAGMLKAKDLTISTVLSPYAVEQVIIACIGPKTAQTARELNWPVHIVATDYTIPGLVQALVTYYE